MISTPVGRAVLGYLMLLTGMACAMLVLHDDVTRRTALAAVNWLAAEIEWAIR